VSTSSERAEERRKAKLAQMQQQIEDGTLTVRKMTAKERAANPPRSRIQRGRARKRG
jgi:hypothetical protein